MTRIPFTDYMPKFDIVVTMFVTVALITVVTIIGGPSALLLGLAVLYGWTSLRQATTDKEEGSDTNSTDMATENQKGNEVN